MNALAPENSKGQSINIDWTIGMSVFMVAVILGVFVFFNQNPGISGVADKREKAFLVSEELEQETLAEGRQAPLYIRGPSDVGKIPVDQDYVFHSSGYPGSGAMDVPADIDMAAGRVVTVTGTGNLSHELSYFFDNTTNLSYSNSIDTGSWMNNTQVSLKPGNPGILSLKVNGNELLNPDAELDGSDYTVTEHQLHASSLNGDLKLYNGSNELIIEDGGTFNIQDLSTLYWYEDNSTTALTGTGTFKDGNTSGLTVAGSYGITFLGKLDAKVSKPSSSEIKVEINTSRTRVLLHDSGWETGWQRIRFHDRGDVSFGAEEVLEGVSGKKLLELENVADSELENRLKLENWGYNLTLGSLERGEPIPLEQVVVNNRPDVLLGRYGNYSRIEKRVAVWR